MILCAGTATHSGALDEPAFFTFHMFKLLAFSSISYTLAGFGNITLVVTALVNLYAATYKYDLWSV